MVTGREVNGLSFDDLCVIPRSYRKIMCWVPVCVCSECYPRAYVKPKFALSNQSLILGIGIWTLIPTITSKKQMIRSVRT